MIKPIMFFKNKKQKPLLIHKFLEPETRSECYFVIDTLHRNTCGGGIRIVDDGITAEEAKVLAKNMTKKYCLAELNLGGAKLCINLKGDKKIALMGCGKIIRDILKPDNITYFPGTDMGTSPADIRYFTRCAGFNHIRQSFSFKSDFYTYIGIKTSLEFLIKKYNINKRKTRVAMEGFGKVAKQVAYYLYKNHFKIIVVSDKQWFVHDEHGLNIPLMLKGDIWKKSLSTHDKKISRDNIFEVESDIFIPGARIYSINAKTSKKIKTKFICSIANAPIAPGIEKKLESRGIKILPDTITNLGGVLGSHHDFINTPKKRIVPEIRKSINSLLRRWYNNELE